MSSRFMPHPSDKSMGAIFPVKREARNDEISEILCGIIIKKEGRFSSHRSIIIDFPLILEYLCNLHSTESMISTRSRDPVEILKSTVREGKYID